MHFRTYCHDITKRALENPACAEPLATAEAGVALMSIRKKAHFLIDIKWIKNKNLIIQENTEWGYSILIIWSIEDLLNEFARQTIDDL